MNARPFRRPKYGLFLLLAILLLLVVGVPAAQAAVWTDQLDYAPGSVVTISGDNVGLVEPWAIGAEVTVEVAGPLGYEYGPLSAIVGLDGSWSCQFTLSDDAVRGRRRIRVHGHCRGLVRDPERHLHRRREWRHLRPGLPMT